MSVGDGRVELLRFPEAGSARDAARRLLAAGVPPEVVRDGDDHVVEVQPAHVEAAALALGIEAPDGAAVGGASRSEEDAAEEDAVEEGAVEDLTELVVDDRGFVVVAVAVDEPAARQLAARLVERGIGPELVPAVDTGHADPGAVAGEPVSVQVLEVDADRALAVLGRDSLPPRVGRPPGRGAGVSAGALAGEAAPAGRSAGSTLRRRAEPEGVRDYFGGRVRLTRRQLRTIVALYLAALVLVPLAFFFLTRELLSDDVERPVSVFEPRVVDAPAPSP